MFAEPRALRLEPVRPNSEPFPQRHNTALLTLSALALVQLRLLGLRLFDGLTRSLGDRPMVTLRPGARWRRERSPHKRTAAPVAWR
jgi:hypothetical protein